MLFEKFCDLRFSRKLRYREIVFVELLHVSCMGWEVKSDMSGLKVYNVKMKKNFNGAETVHIAKNVGVTGL